MVMVMETPSPQNVGLQFVRQYYTVLNQAPEHLHRFYSSNSSFVHGGIDCPGKPEPVHPAYGQQEIHKKIMQLNFRDCHAKIRLVDSQATLGDGVVVQVTGELSNNGQPMRRFMQTFVLALQSVRKYYVHNDILRYQDEVFPDEDENDLSESAVEAEIEEERPEVTSSNVQDVSMSHYYNQRAVNNGTAHLVEAQVATSLNTVTTPVAPVMSTPVPQSAPVVAPSLPPLAPRQAQSPPQHQQQQQQQQLPPAVVQLSPEPENNIMSDNEKNDYSSQEEEDYQEKSLSKSPEPVEPVEPTPDEPKTYATMVSKNTVSFGSSPSAASGVSGSSNNAQKAPFNIPNNQSPLRPDHVKSDSGLIPPQPQKPPRPKMNMMRGGGSSNYTMPPRERISSTRSIPDDSNELDRRRSTSQYPDSQQLFVGKLPHDVDDDSLREVFSEFGNVVDMRINIKSTMTKNGPSVGYNFGFVVFDDPAAVQRILAAKPIFYREQRLNIEEKKKRENRTGIPNMGRMGGGPGRGGPMMGGGRGGPRGGGFGGMSRGDGGRGGSRGGGFGPPPNRR